ncbi:MAG: MBOAT family O-acyltransferase [Betaproteobacteria bacterium]
MDSLAIILPSIVLDYLLGKGIENADVSRRKLRATLLCVGIAANIAVLGYFKYWNFFLDTSNQLFATDFLLTRLILPLGLSFITFQKIAYLMDVYTGEVKGGGFMNFLLFTLFFPRVVAGPIVHYQEVMPQLTQPTVRWVPTNIAVGICLFSMGLFKKVVIADGLAEFVGPVFASPLNGQPVTLLPGWIGALAFTFQIYFDFSGYSDMALGVARIFGVVLPMNFNSPLKASSIVEFWGRWHITLTRFLTAYLYTPMLLSLTRRRIAHGKPVLKGRRTAMSAILILIGFPTVVTMTVSGFWHGVGVQFIVWGMLHGLMLTANQAWRIWRPRFWRDQASYERIMTPVGFGLTFIAFVVTVVFFRAGSVADAISILKGMAGLNGVSIPYAIGSRLGGFGRWLESAGVTYDWSSGSQFIASLAWLGVLFVIVTRMPNSLELLAPFRPALDFPGQEPETAVSSGAGPDGVQPIHKDLVRRRFGPAFVALMAVAGVLGLQRASEFLYWQF